MKKTGRGFALSLVMLMGVAFLFGSGSLSASAEDGSSDPAFYRKQATWEETVRLSLKALTESETRASAARRAAQTADPAAARFKPVDETFKLKDKPRKVFIKITGLKEICLHAVGTKKASALLAAPRLIAAGGAAVAWNPLAPSTVLCNPTHIKSPKKALRINRQPVADATLWEGAEATIPLDGKYETFEAWLGIQGGKDDAVAEFNFYQGSRFLNKEHHDKNIALIWTLTRRDFGPTDADNKVSVADPDQILSRGSTPADIAKRYAGACQGAWQVEARKLAATVKTAEELAPLRRLYYATVRARDAARQLEMVNPEAMERAIKDMEMTWPGRYQGDKYRAALAQFTQRKPLLLEGLTQGTAAALAEAESLAATLREALLANPLLDANQMLVVRRTLNPGQGRRAVGASTGLIGLNSHTNDDIPHTGWDNEITLVGNLRGTPQFKTLFKPQSGKILRDLDLEFGGKRIMFSSIGDNDRWGIFEVGADGAGLKQLTPTDLPDVDFFDSCYLPDGRFITGSTASYQGLPCENGGRPMVNLFLADPAKASIRQVTFEQDSDWHPAVMGNGRVLYLRWEYTDIMHYYSRRLMTMNPDGTNQATYYGSGSMFPPAFKFAKPMPGHPRKVIGVIAGHHDMPEAGRMAIIDPELGRKYPFRFHPASKEWGAPGTYMDLLPEILPASKTGFVQEVPGWGKDVVGNVTDSIANVAFKSGKPIFLWPHPLSDKYFLVSMKHDKDALWGVYLADVFDNMTLIAEVEDAVLYQPILLQARPRPPVIPDRVNLASKTATVEISDIYRGPGLAGIPRGAVKKLRIFSYHYAYNKTGGHASVGYESSWDIKRILGTVPVEADGSARFTIPANTPVSLQPLDSEGRALQLMRTWFVGMPGESVSCVGCHEQQNMSLPAVRTAASLREPSAPKPWYGGPRPFAFPFEVYPVLEKNCSGCHNGPTERAGKPFPSFKEAKIAYETLHPYTRRPGPESDQELFRPMEYHASISPLIQMLKKGHHGVALTPEEYERIYCWIDLNVPNRGSWDPETFRDQPQVARRLELACKFANLTDNPEAEYKAVAEAFAKRAPVAFVAPKDAAPTPQEDPKAEGWPLTPAAAAALQQQAGGAAKVLDLGRGTSFSLTRIPAGAFVMGSREGYSDERPRAAVTIVKPFWMGTFEVTNRQYNLFDPEHDTRYIDENGKDHMVPGYIANHPDQPVARVTWAEALAYCQWLGKKTGLKVTLPTEAQWEWAARAGSEGRFGWGGVDDDFSPYANLADRMLRFTAVGFDGGGVLHYRKPLSVNLNYPLHEERYADKWFVVDYVGQNKPNPWGLYDTTGNVCEWTRSSYQPYPYREDDGRNDLTPAAKKVARGGSWADRPKDAGAAIRFAYESYQSVFNVGFRVIVEE